MRTTICAAAFAVLTLACGGSAAPRLVVLAEHHLAWPAWEEARHRGEIGPGPVLLHLDAHEDMGEPEFELPGSVDPETALQIATEDLMVDEPIRPALATGTVGRVVWVTPPWLEEVPPVSDSRVSSASLVDLQAIDGEAILDIDLDFFACENPHATHFDREIAKEEYERRRAGGRIYLEGDAEEGDTVTESVVLARPPGIFEWPIRLDRVKNTVTGEERFVRGYICMGEYRDEFPVHRPSVDEVASLVGQVEAALSRARIRPVLITIARSASSGFVPTERADEIEAAVLGMLRRLYPRVSVRD